VNKQKKLQQQRIRRQYRSRTKSRGTLERPRLTVYRSLKHLTCQLVDDGARKTLVSVSTRERSLREEFVNGGNCGAAQRLGKILAERALAAGIHAARFDRGHYRYHGRIAALADAAREAGLSF
jgi:large subunit ribosomal protein L18